MKTDTSDFYSYTRFYCTKFKQFVLVNGKRYQLDFLHNLDKIELKKIRFNKVNFNFELADIKNFYKHLNTNIAKPIEIRNSNFFYQNEKKEIISISNSKKFDYFIDIREKQKKIKILGIIFGTNYIFVWTKNFSNPKKTGSL